MPTTVTKIVDPDNGGGTDYTSLSAAEAAQQQDLVTNDRVLVFECRSTSGTADTTNVTFDGWTTDATRYAVVQSSGSNKHSGAWDTAKYTLETVGAAITIAALKLIVDGVQIYSYRIGNYSSACVSMTLSDNSRVRNCILRVNSANHGSNCIESNNSDAIYLYNNLCLLEDTGGGTHSGIYLVSGTNDGAWVENNTIIKNATNGTNQGIESAGGAVVVARNNLVYNFGNTTTYVGTFASGTDNNTTDSTDSIGAGSNNSTSQTFTFTNAGTGDYSLASGDTGARDKGTTLATVSSGFTDDIIGTARDGSGAIDCGCFEFAGAAAIVYNRLMLLGCGA